MDKNGQVGELLEKGQSTVTNVVSDAANSVKSQVLGDEKKPQVVQSGTVQNHGESSPQQQQEASQRTKEVVSDFYSPSQELGQQPVAANIGDEEKLLKIRQELQQEKLSHQQLHEEVYYKPLFAYEQRQGNQAERPAETAQREKHQDLEEHLEVQAKKDQDIATQRAQRHIEINPGVAG